MALLGLLNSRFDLLCYRSGYSQNISSPLSSNLSFLTLLGWMDGIEILFYKKGTKRTLFKIRFHFVLGLKWNFPIILYKITAMMTYPSTTLHTFTYTLINSTHSSSLLYSTLPITPRLFAPLQTLLSSMISYIFKLFLILMLQSYFLPC